MGKLCDRVRTESNMFAAWRHVKRSALNSANGEIRGAAAEFEHQHQRHIRRSIDQLRTGKFQFDEVLGVLADQKSREKVGKDPRPIAIATLKNRVVQRAILQVLQPRSARDVRDIDTRHQTVRDPALGKINDVNTSAFGVGGLIKPYGGVGPAIDLIMGAMNNGAKHYYRSDIKAFFTDIPVDPVIKFVRDETKDDALADLFAKGLEVHLANSEELKGYASLFPSNGRGVAQGSSLSAFAGNILLFDMDHELNQLNVAAVRYIDDIMIVSETASELSKAIALAESHLGRLGFRLYQPSKGSDKAATGDCSQSFGFLGCTLQPNRCVPSSQSIQRLKDDVNEKLSKSHGAIKAFAQEGKNLDPKLASSATLDGLGRKIYGWQKSFAFCTDAKPFADLDTYISKRASEFGNAARRLTDKMSDEQKARVGGLPSTEQMFRQGIAKSEK